MVYAPGTLETDPKKQNMALQQQASAIKTATTDIATNTADIASLQAASSDYVVGPASATNNGFAVFDGATGKLIKNHAATVALGSEVSGTLPVANGGTNYTGGAWTAWTPTVTPTSGSFTTVSASGSYLSIGKIVFFSVSITLTNIGTGTGKVNLPLPVGNAAQNFVLPCIEVGATGKTGTLRGVSGSGTGVIQAYDNSTSLMVNGYVIVVSGSYEST
jgi:hypothetical protein